ncbi:Cysteine-rich with EGF-like domain protein 1 [Liparis tanakae]|uniref:Cysteine-rich with EGF-like domain protein 1 n=1 Tax=Liparis tanakae TaxID=230148 RepID=A0A4Z2G5W5_9TELE|nr:Cysteine-rich with EGF-like domain protein 1 [Liparis tanakae]
MWWAWPFLPALVLLSELSVVRVQTAPCQTCRKLTESFIKVTREARLLEIVEGACEKADFECNQLLEQIEDQVETWWFHRQQEAPDLSEWLCIEELRVCCPPGSFGPDCKDIDECGTELARCAANTFCHNTEGSYECRGCDQACVGCMGSGPARCKKCARGYKLRGAKRGRVSRSGDRVPGTQRGMFFGVVICAIATLAAKGDMVFTAIFIGGVAAMAGYWLTEKGDVMLDGFIKGR